MATIRRTNTKSGEHERWTGLIWTPEGTRINPKNGEHEEWGIFGWHHPVDPSYVPNEEKESLRVGFDDVRQSQETALVDFQSQLELLEEGNEDALRDLRWEMENRESEYSESLDALESRVDELESERGEIASEIKNFRRENRLQHLKMFAQLDEILEGEQDIKGSLQEIIARLIAIEALNYATSVSSLEEAREAWNLSPRGTLAETVSDKKWNQFALPKIVAAETLEEGERALKDCREGSSAYWVAKEKVQLFRLCKVTTVKEAKALYDEIAPSASIKALAKKEWEFLALQQVLMAKTAREAKQAFDDAPSDGKAREHAVQKWESFALAEVAAAITPEELKAVLRITPPGGSAQQLAKEKIAKAEAEAQKAKEEAAREAQRKLLISRIEGANSIAEIQKFLSEVKVPQEIRELAFRKGNELLYGNVDCIIQKLDSERSFSSLKELLLEAKQLFIDTINFPAGQVVSDCWEKSALRLSHLANKADSLEYVIKNAPQGGPAQQLAQRKILELQAKEKFAKVLEQRVAFKSQELEEKRRKKEKEAIMRQTWKGRLVVWWGNDGPLVVIMIVVALFLVYTFYEIGYELFKFFHP